MKLNHQNYTQSNLNAVKAVSPKVPIFVAAEDVRGRARHMLKSVQLIVQTVDQRQTPIITVHMSQDQH